MAADLEDALAIEAARAGGATGEATSVLRTLPAPTRRRLPLRLRLKPALLLALLVLVLAVVIGLVVAATTETRRGTRPPSVKASPGLHPVNLRSNAAQDYDPYGGDGEHPEQVNAAIDDDPNSSWSTQTYFGKQLGKPGVGLYVDASPGLAAKRLDLRTGTPGWTGAIYGARSGPPQQFDQGGWVKLADVADVQRSTRVTLATRGRSFRFYLVWITKLPPDGTQVSISDLGLLR
jgi:serine/threonine-protein kinase